MVVLASRQHTKSCAMTAPQCPVVLSLSSCYSGIRAARNKCPSGEMSAKQALYQAVFWCIRDFNCYRTRALLCFTGNTLSVGRKQTCVSYAPCLNLYSWTQHSHKDVRPVSAVWTPDNVAWLWQRSASLQSPGVSPRKLHALESCRTAGKFGSVTVTSCEARMAAHQLFCILQLHQIMCVSFFLAAKGGV